jgi:cell division septal protein FtsQ
MVSNTILILHIGNLGDGTTTHRNVPTALNTTKSYSALYGKVVAKIDCYDQTCIALTTDNNMIGWGRNLYVTNDIGGGIGDGSLDGEYTT